MSIFVFFFASSLIRNFPFFFDRERKKVNESAYSIMILLYFLTFFFVLLFLLQWLKVCVRISFFPLSYFLKFLTTRCVHQHTKITHLNYAKLLSFFYNFCLIKSNKKVRRMKKKSAQDGIAECLYVREHE